MKTDKNPQYPVKIGWDVFSSWACKLENENCTKMALHYFRRWRNGEEYSRNYNILLKALFIGNEMTKIRGLNYLLFIFVLT